MSGPFRLPAGGRIDRGRPLSFTFNGERLQGYAGDTLASALLANGKWIVGRSWKYHRPRGIVAAGVEEPNAILQIGEGARAIPNARATEIELHEGLIARSVGGWPSVENDVLAVTGWFARLLPAGFYYKTFMWPASGWMGYERLIRKMSGLGAAPAQADRDRYEKMNAHCDVLVVGAGPAGLMAALAAGQAGARVILAELGPELGGSLLASGAILGGVPAVDWVAARKAELAALPEVRVLTRATVFGYHDHNFLTIAERLRDHLGDDEPDRVRERVWRVRARQVILATGAHERPLVFADNDRPGILLASALVSYIRRYAVLPGARVVVATNNDSAYAAALAAKDAGATAVTVIDARGDIEGGSAARRSARAAGIHVLPATVVVRAHGGRHVAAVTAMTYAEGAGRGPPQRLACDLLAVSGGWSPVVHLHSQSGGRVDWKDGPACFVPGAATQLQASVGAACGTFSLAGALCEGAQAGIAAATACGCTGGTRAVAVPAVAEDPEQPLLPLWCGPGPWAPGRGPKAFVDFQNDVSVADIYLAAREGYESIEHVKRYTALGFGTDQGKLGNINGMAILAEALGQPIAAIGTTTFRPNYTPVTFGALAGADLGDCFDPIRQTALHEWHAERGARFEDVGQWKRPWYYPAPGEAMEDAVRRECRAVRNGVGIFDASTLGKIDIQGPDAVGLLNRVYCNGWSNLAVGRCRYGLMLGEDGMVMDDGVTARLAEHHYLMTTTTGGAARVLAWLERWLQTEWPHMLVYLTSVTEHWATIAVAGPQSRAVLRQAGTDAELDGAAFPFMSVRDGTVAGIPARIARISFSGELAFEINIAADRARQVWEALLVAGEPHGITPYGTEAMHVLRAEKGFIIVGQDTDGSVTPIDLGMGALVNRTKDCIGQRSLARSDTARTDRKQLIGLLSDDPSCVVPEGGQIVSLAGGGGAARALGHVTSSYYSDAAGRAIALALLEAGRERLGEKLHVAQHAGAAIPVTVVKPLFYDPEGARQNVQ